MISNMQNLQHLNLEWDTCFFTIQGMLGTDLESLLSVLGHTIYKKHNLGRSSMATERWFLKAACGEEWRIDASPFDGVYAFRCAPWVRQKREREEKKKEGEA